MPTLAEIQSAVSDALVRGHRHALTSTVAGGLRPERRFAIHQRHYAASLTKAVLNRFPLRCGWSAPIL